MSSPRAIVRGAAERELLSIKETPLPRLGTWGMAPRGMAPRGERFEPDMANPNLTSIHVVLDRSGSMQSVREDIIGGFNAFLAEQRAHPSDAWLTLAQFDDQYEIVHDHVSLGDVPELDQARYVPRGTTALLDALGRTINAAHARITALPEAHRPGKVIVLVMTDGLENASKEFRKADVVSLIQARQKMDGWELVFVGADLASIGEAGQLGFAEGKRLRSDLKSATGVREAYDKLSKGLSKYRSQDKSQIDEFFDDDD